jgi:hypothetical protein
MIGTTRQNSKILAPHGFSFSLNALRSWRSRERRGGRSVICRVAKKVGDWYLVAMQKEPPRLGRHVLYKDKIHKVIACDDSTGVLTIALPANTPFRVFLTEVICLTLAEENEYVILAGLSNPKAYGSLLRRLMVE